MLLNTDTLRDFLEGSLPAVSALCADLSYIGLEVESATSFDLPDLVVVGQVLECAKHPDAAKLHVCQVDMGSEVLQIVCGAGNVGVGQFVAVALQGAYLPACNLSIQASHLRGVQSLGMLCSAVELGLPKTNEGILILDSSINHDKPLKLGTPLKDLPFFKGTLLDIAITPNRGDCLSVLGLAREMSVLYHLPLKSPPKLAIGAPLDIQTAPNLPPCALNYALLDLKPSMPLEIALSLALQHNLQPDPLANFLEYATYLSGVLLHAYPHVRLEVGINSAGFVCVGDHAQTLSVLGVSPPSLPTSTPYLIEASFIDPEHVCQSLHAHPIENSPTLTHRSKRGSDPQVLVGLEWLAFLLQRFAPQANLQVSPPSTPALPAKTLNFSPQDIGDILGQTPSKERIQEILKTLRFELCDQGDQFLATIPPFRHDISTIPDIAEEILRIQGLDDLPKSSLATFEPSSANPHYTRHLFERQIATKALAWGFKEVVHYLFAKKEHLETLGYPTLQENLDLLNPINSDLNTLRTSLIPGLLEALGRNKNWGFKSVALFELGSVYDTQRTQQPSLAFLVAGLQTPPHSPPPNGTEWDFYSFTAMLA
ncbi:YtpR family tRNA-binding protein, partial [Helicobacter bizzozeronii]|uniref:YtpR family tRNA-binding protein n=1 Tax=Helicobacter bizzozeronii TaxID=56877 RepID=UPI000CF02DB2